MFYFNRSNWEINLKPSSPNDLRISPLVMLLLAPCLGAGLVLFLPFAGLYLMGKELLTYGVKHTYLCKIKG
jgi:hypothetical protein